MLIEFSIANYRSIKEMQTISFRAAKMKSKFSDVDENNTFQANAKFQLLKSIAVYGANASGKSNLIRALSGMLNFVYSSVKDESALNRFFENEQFALDPKSSSDPSFFQIIFLLEGIPYRYGFEVSGKKIHSEWLFYTPKTEEVELFTRSNLEVKVDPRHFKEGSDKKNTNLYSTSSLFFSVVSSFNGEKSKKIESYFKTITIISGLNDGIWGRKTISFLEDSSYQVKILKLLEFADTGINDIRKIELNPENIPADGIPNAVSEKLRRIVGDGIKIQSALTSRTFKDENGNTVSREFLLDQHESEGTKKLIAYSVPLIDSMKNPVILIIDEFDARFHPLITRKILQLFHSKELNIHNSQILIATHDVTLLKADILRRDQIYFAEKDQSHSTRYYSLSDFKGIRNDASFDKDYINGRYGAIPFLGNFEDFLKEHSNEAN